MTVAAHHQQICTEAAAFCDQNVGAVVFLADGAIFDGIDAMMPEVQHRIIGLQRVRGLVLAFHSENANFFRLTQKGEGFGHRARQLVASVPRHNDVVERRRASRQAPETNDVQRRK